MSINSYIFRKYNDQTDRIQLINLWSEVFPNDPPHNEPSAMLDHKLKIDDFILVALEDTTLIGAVMCGYDGHRGWLYAVAVSASKRRKYIGQQLINMAKTELKQLGCIKVNLQIRHDNAEVKAFYQNLGFHDEPRISMGCFLN